MIRPIDIRLNAAHPELPLCEAVTYTGAPSTVLIRGVPPNCGRWAITAVFVAAAFPDGTTTTRTAVQSANGVWVATLPATATSGRTANGIRIMADGVDENGEAVTGYILGVADFAIASLAVTPAPEPGGTAYALRYFDALPDPAKKGDVIRINGDLKFYNGAEWLPFTDLSDYYTKEQVDEAIDKLAAYYITADAQGNPFATYASLVNASVYYSGGSARTPTRNDYAVVSADEMHGGAEWRYIYAVDAQGVGQWDPQYAVGGVIVYDDTVTRTSANGVKSSGIWSMLWGALTALPAGFSSLYDWCVAQLAGKADASALTAHTGDTTIHVTAADKTAWNAKQSALSQAQLDAVNSGITAAKVSAYDGYAATIAGKADAADLRYSYNTATVSSGTTPTVTDVADRAINTATLGSSVTAATVTLPAATADRARDFFIDLTIEATTAPTLTFIDPATNTTANVTFGADSLADIDTGRNAVLFTEFPNYTWIVSVKHEEVTA